MTATQVISQDFAPRVETPSGRRGLAAVAALAALGDFLLFGHSPGLSLALFAGAVEVASVFAAAPSARGAALATLVGAATLAPLVEDANALSLTIAAFGAGAVALIANGAIRGDFAEWNLNVLRFLAAGPFRILFDMPKVAPGVLRGGAGSGDLIAWMLPLGLGAVFLALFSAANPVIERWLAEIDLRPLLALFDFWRIIFWLALFALVWPFVLFRARTRGGVDEPSPAQARVGARSARPGGFLSLLLGEGAILRSLVVFNALFAVQTLLDAAILWRGHALPAGVSFAAYAHRGAYPLMATALLAAAFVILAVRPGSSAAQSMSIRTLVYLWIGQNVALVVSSLYRLDLYVRVYSLTYWRVAAFAWMGLVAVGLVLIIVQLSTRRTSRWLLSANAVAAAVALYLSSFVNLDYLIADYNLRHCAGVISESAELDLDYLRSLGPEAIPALDAALARTGTSFASGKLRAVRAAIDAERRAKNGDWRSWTFRKWRLSQRLDAGAASNP